MNRYRPAEIKFSNAEEMMQAGRNEVAKHGELIMDVGEMGGGNTLAVCALLEWKRRAAADNHRLRFENIPPRLQQLIAVYQLEDLLLSEPAKSKPAE